MLLIAVKNKFSFVIHIMMQKKEKFMNIVSYFKDLITKAQDDLFFNEVRGLHKSINN
jgi:hypothetical protein